MYVCVCVFGHTCRITMTRKYKLTNFLNCSHRNLKIKVHTVYLPVLIEGREEEEGREEGKEGERRKGGMEGGRKEGGRRSEGGRREGGKEEGREEE